MNEYATSISLLSCEISDPNYTSSPDETLAIEEKNMETDHSISGNEDEGHAATQRVYTCCNNYNNNYVSYQVAVFHDHERNLYLHDLVTHYLGGFYVI